MREHRELTKYVALWICWTALVAAVSAAQINTTFELPSFAATILESQFPEPKSTDLSDLRRHRQDLEFFRESVLEGYNRGLKDYALKLDTASKQLEQNRRMGRIAKDAYGKSHVRIQEELTKLRPDGDYLMVYKLFLARYQRRANWVIQEITRKERQQLRF